MSDRQKGNQVLLPSPPYLPPETCGACSRPPAPSLRGPHSVRTVHSPCAHVSPIVWALTLTVSSSIRVSPLCTPLTTFLFSRVTQVSSD